MKSKRKILCGCPSGVFLSAPRGSTQYAPIDSTQYVQYSTGTIYVLKRTVPKAVKNTASGRDTARHLPLSSY